MSALVRRVEMGTDVFRESPASVVEHLAAMLVILERTLEEVTALNARVDTIQTQVNSRLPFKFGSHR